MNSAEIKQLCGGTLSQIRGLFAGIEKMPLVFEDLERREAAVVAKENRLEDLTAAIAKKERREAEVSASLAPREARLLELNERIRTTAAHPRLQELDEQIKEKTEALAAIRADYEAFQRKHGLVQTA
jgi:chromosome segregation ATPase